MTSILGEQGNTHFSYPPAMISKENSSPQPTGLGREKAGASPESGGIQQDMSKLNMRPVPTLSIDDTSKMDEEKDVEKDGQVYDNPSAILSQSSTDTDDSISRIHSMAEMERLDFQKLPPFRSLRPHANTTDEAGRRGQAHNPLEDHLYLYIGPSTFSGVSSKEGDDGTFVPDDETVPIVSESPGAADVDIYETAYRDEIERIMARAQEEKKEPNVYLTRRVDDRLMAISGLAGKWAAMGEEAKNQIKDYTHFSARKARVTEVSRALRHAAREEYERRKHEHREWIAAEKAERNRVREEEASKSSTRTPTSTPGSPPTASGEGEASPSSGSPQSPSKQSSLWKGRAVDAGRQARTSILGLMEMVKNKNRTQSKDEEG